MVITWRILYSCFIVGSFRCLSYNIDSRVRHAYFCVSIARRLSAAHSKVGDTVGNAPLCFYAQGWAANKVRGKRKRQAVAHKIWMRMEYLDVEKSGVDFDIFSGTDKKSKMGTLNVSKGSISWKANNARKSAGKSWEVFAEWIEDRQ